MVGIMFIAVVILTIIQVFCRFVLDSPLVWSEELARFILVWMTMLGSSVLCYEKSHLSITEFADAMPAKYKVLVAFASNFILLFLLGTILYVSPKLLRASVHIQSGALEIPFAYWRGAAPAGCLLMAFYTLCNIEEDVRRLFDNGSEKTKLEETLS
jgi:TRAP-type C4-dicarboxylate transport system permease small subunit